MNGIEKLRKYLVDNYCPEELGFDKHSSIRECGEPSKKKCKECWDKVLDREYEEDVQE